MKSPLLAELVKPAETTRRIVWWAFFGAVLFYVFLLYFITANTPPVPIPRGFAYCLTVLSVFQGLAAFVLPGILLSRPRLQKILAKDRDLAALARSAQTGTTDQNRVSRIKMLSPGEQSLMSFVPALFSIFIIRLAFCESIALYGLVLGQISHSVAPVLPFAAASAVLMLTVSPSLDSSFERASALLRTDPNASVAAG